MNTLQEDRLAAYRHFWGDREMFSATVYWIKTGSWPDGAEGDERRRLDDYAQRLTALRTTLNDLSPNATGLLRQIAADLAALARLRSQDACAESMNECTEEKVNLLNALAALLEER